MRNIEHRTQNIKVKDENYRAKFPKGLSMNILRAESRPMRYGSYGF